MNMIAILGAFFILAVVILIILAIVFANKK